MNSTAILIDTNVFMYAAGQAHPLKQPSIEVLRLAARSSAYFTDAEVFQEILHRYAAQRRWQTMRAATYDFLTLMGDRALSVHASDVNLAGGLVDRYPRLAARDLIHLAVMHRVGAGYIATTDKAFGDVEGIERLDPMRVEEWRSLVTG